MSAPTITGFHIEVLDLIGTGKAIYTYPVAKAAQLFEKWGLVEIEETPDPNSFAYARLTKEGEDLRDSLTSALEQHDLRLPGDEASAGREVVNE